MPNVLLIGCGKMGQALLRGWLSSEVTSQQEVSVVDPHTTETYGCPLYRDAGDVPSSLLPDVVVVAVKPQVLSDVLLSYKNRDWGSAVFMSVAAGKKTGALAELVGKDKAVVRVMPNLPALVGEGVCVAVCTEHVSEQQRGWCEALLAAVGSVHWIEDESWMDAVTAVSGSGPAYLFYFIEALVDAGKEAGLPETLATSLACETVYGSALLAIQSEEGCVQLRKNVTSPGGTTEAALKVLMGEKEEISMKSLIKKAVDAAKERSEALS